MARAKPPAKFDHQHHGAAQPPDLMIARTSTYLHKATRRLISSSNISLTSTTFGSLNGRAGNQRAITSTADEEHLRATQNSGNKKAPKRGFFELAE